MMKNHVKKIITDCLWDSYFQLSNNQFNSNLNLNTATESGNLYKVKARLKFSLIGITFAFTMIASTALLSSSKLFLLYRDNKFDKIKSHTLAIFYFQILIFNIKNLKYCISIIYIKI
jgi:hypothetical protein